MKVCWKHQNKFLLNYFNSLKREKKNLTKHENRALRIRFPVSGFLSPKKTGNEGLE